MQENTGYINRLLNPTKVVEAFLEDSVAEKISFKIGNVYTLPVEVVGLRYRNETYKLIGENVLDAKQDYERITFKDFHCQRPIDSLNFDSMFVICKILGGTREITENIYLWPVNTFDTVVNDILIDGSNFSEFESLKISDDSIITLEDNLIFHKPLVIPRGYRVNIMEGTTIDFTNKSLLLSYSPIIAIGTQEHPVRINSSDSTGMGLAVLCSCQESYFENVWFSTISRPSGNGWELTGAVTFYESNVKMDNCIFSDNISGDDYLNIIRSDFLITNSLFKNVKADALDPDFCKGRLENTNFFNIGNDAVDVSGTFIELMRILIDNAGDKGLSTGEKSTMHASNITIKNSEIALTSKDLSVIRIFNSELTNNRLAYAIFQKKSEFGPAQIFAENIAIPENEKNFLIEEQSLLMINGTVYNEHVKNVKQYLYGASYGKPSH